MSPRLADFHPTRQGKVAIGGGAVSLACTVPPRSEEHTSEPTPFESVIAHILCRHEAPARFRLWERAGGSVHAKRIAPLPIATVALPVAKSSPRVADLPAIRQENVAIGRGAIRLACTLPP